MPDTWKSSPNGFKWDTSSEAFAEGRDGQPNRYSALTDYQQWVDWLHGRAEANRKRMPSLVPISQT